MVKHFKFYIIRLCIKIHIRICHLIVLFDLIIFLSWSRKIFINLRIFQCRCHFDSCLIKNLLLLKSDKLSTQRFISIWFLSLNFNYLSFIYILSKRCSSWNSKCYISCFDSTIMRILIGSLPSYNVIWMIRLTVIRFSLSINSLRFILYKSLWAEMMIISLHWLLDALQIFWW